MWLFKYWRADAAVRCLDMEQSTDGGSNIGHVGQLAGLARGDVPSHENQGDMGVALAPCTVVGPGFLLLACIDTSAWYDVNFTAALGEIT